MIDANTMRYVAVAVVWLGVGISSFGAKENTQGVAFFAFFATMFMMTR